MWYLPEINDVELWSLSQGLSVFYVVQSNSLQMKFTSALVNAFSLKIIFVENGCICTSAHFFSSLWQHCICTMRPWIRGLDHIFQGWGYPHRHEAKQRWLIIRAALWWIGNWRATGANRGVGVLWVSWTVQHTLERPIILQKACVLWLVCVCVCWVCKLVWIVQAFKGFGSYCTCCDLRHMN